MVSAPFITVAIAQKFPPSFFLSFFVTVPLHSLKYNSQRFRRKYRGLKVVIKATEELFLVVCGE